MARPTAPAKGDVVIHQRSSALFAISAAGSDPQPTCETIEAAVEVAIDVARRYGGRVWYTTDLKHFSEVLDD